MKLKKRRAFAVIGTTIFVFILLFMTGFKPISTISLISAFSNSTVTNTTKATIVNSNNQQGSYDANQPAEKTMKYNMNVSIAEQKVRIYKDGALLKEFLVSTGVDQTTPKGDFEIQNRGEWFYSQKYQQGAKWWVSFKNWGEFLFHTVPMDSSKQIIMDEANKLGIPASHGCIRLTVDDAKWIYDNIPQGASVHIE